jgi:hypothetical protein
MDALQPFVMIFFCAHILSGSWLFIGYISWIEEISPMQYISFKSCDLRFYVWFFHFLRLWQVRPTSETIVNHMFTQWIHSYRDLPLLINQVNAVLGSWLRLLPKICFLLCWDDLI